MSESCILCEGYHDRAFWGGWLLHLGCVDPGISLPGRTGRVDVYDPWKTKVTGGQYAYHSPSGEFVRVVPCHGKTKVLPLAKTRLQQRSTKPLLRLVINIDSDMTVGGESTGPLGLRQPDVLQMVQAFDSNAVIDSGGEIELDGGATKVSLVRWEVPDPPSQGLPNQQCLERLVSAALAAAYPARAPHLQSWLDARPEPPEMGPKDYAWSYMAGWYAELGCEAFYSNLWKDPLVAAELVTRLKSSGAWRIAELLAG